MQKYHIYSPPLHAIRPRSMPKDSCIASFGLEAALFCLYICWIDVIIEVMNMKEQTKVAEQSRDLMCVMCKSFFGNEAFGNMCSQCFKKHAPQSITRKQQSQPLSKPNDTIESKQELKKEEKKEINKERCTTCNRKLKLLGVECRCGFFFCNSHRLPEDHSCAFDHKNAGKQRLLKEVVKVQNGKIESI